MMLRVSLHQRIYGTSVHHATNLSVTQLSLFTVTVPCAKHSIAAIHTQSQTETYRTRSLLIQRGAIEHNAHVARYSTTTALHTSTTDPATATATATATAAAAVPNPIPIPTPSTTAATATPSIPTPTPIPSYPNVPPHLPPPRYVNRPHPSGSSSSAIPTSSSQLGFTRTMSQQLLDIEAFALTEKDPGKKVSLAAYQKQFDDVFLKQQPIAELMKVFRSWVSHMPQPPDLAYIHRYFEARVRMGHSITAVLVDLAPFINQFTEHTLEHVMIQCAKLRSTEETVGALRFIHTQISHRIPLTLPLMNRFIKNFSLQNDISGATILYDELANYSLIPDHQTYEAMYLGFARMKEMEATFSVFGHMQQRGIALKVSMFEEVIETCVRYDNAEAGLLTLQRIGTFTATQPVNADGTKTPLTLTPRCFELLIRAYLQKQQLDLVMQIYYELRKADLVLSSLGDFNLLLELVAKNISFQDALQVMADRIQAYEKSLLQIQQLQQAADGHIPTPTPTTPTEDPASTNVQPEWDANKAREALLTIQPIPLPNISSFNILLKIAGLTDRNLSNIQLIISELQRIHIQMNTETFNILIQSYANLKELQGMNYIYEEFKRTSLVDIQQRRAAAIEAKMESGEIQVDSTTNAITTETSPDTSISPSSGPLDPSIIHPDVNTFNIMLAQIDPRTFLQDLKGTQTQGNLQASPPTPDAAGPTVPGTLSPTMKTMSAGLTPSEAASMQTVESLLIDMRSFGLLPDEATFKLILKIMSGVGNPASANGVQDSSASASSSHTVPSASAVVSPHVVHFFNMLMDLVVAHQSNATAAVAAASVTANGGAAGTKSVTTIQFESNWYSFLDFLYRSSNAANQAANFHYILLCLRRLKKDGCGIPKHVIKQLIVNHLGGAQRKPLLQQGRYMMSSTAPSTNPADVAHISEVHWLQAIQFLKEFSPANENVDEEALSALVKSAQALETSIKQSGPSSSTDTDGQPTQSITRIVVHHLQRMLVWNEPADLSRLSRKDIELLKEFGVASTTPSTSSPPTSPSVLVRDRSHFYIFMSCIACKRFDLAMEVISEMQKHQQHVIQQHEAGVLAGTVQAGTPAPVLYVQSQLGTLFKQLLDGMRRTLTTVKPLDWSALRTLFEQCQEWKFIPTMEHFRVLMDEAQRYKSASLARFAYESASNNLRDVQGTTSNLAMYRPDVRFVSDLLLLVFSPPELQISTVASRSGSIEQAATYVDQMDFLQTILTRMVSANMSPLPYDILLRLMAVGEQLESTEIAATLFKYFVGIRKAPDARLYGPLIQLCRFQHAYPLALELYRAVQLADRVPFDCHLELLRLHQYAPLLIDTELELARNSQAWTIFADMIRSVQRGVTSVTQQLYPGSSEHVVLALLSSVQCHPPHQQLQDDLPKISSIIRVLMRIDDAMKAELRSLSPDHTIHLTPDVMVRDGATRRHMGMLKDVLPRLTVKSAQKLMQAVEKQKEKAQQQMKLEERGHTVSSGNASHATDQASRTPTNLSHVLPSLHPVTHDSKAESTPANLAAAEMRDIARAVDSTKVVSETIPSVAVPSTDGNVLTATKKNRQDKKIVTKAPVTGESKSQISKKQPEKVETTMPIDTVVNQDDTLASMSQPNAPVSNVPQFPPNPIVSIQWDSLHPPSLVRVHDAFAHIAPVHRIFLHGWEKGQEAHAFVEFASTAEAIRIQATASTDRQVQALLKATSLRVDFSELTGLTARRWNDGREMMRDFIQEPVKQEEYATITLEIRLPRLPTLVELYQLCTPISTTDKPSDAPLKITVVPTLRDGKLLDSTKTMAIVLFASPNAAAKSHAWLKDLRIKRGVTIKSSRVPTDFSTKNPLRQRDFQLNPIQPGEPEEILIHEPEPATSSTTLTQVQQVTNLSHVPPSLHSVTDDSIDMKAELTPANLAAAEMRDIARAVDSTKVVIETIPSVTVQSRASTIVPTTNKKGQDKKVVTKESVTEESKSQISKKQKQTGVPTTVVNHTLASLTPPNNFLSDVQEIPSTSVVGIQWDSLLPPSLGQVHDAFAHIAPVHRVYIFQKSKETPTLWSAYVQFRSTAGAIKAHATASTNKHVISMLRSTTLVVVASKRTMLTSRRHNDGRELMRDFIEVPLKQEEYATITLEIRLPRLPTLVELYQLCTPISTADKSANGPVKIAIVNESDAWSKLRRVIAIVVFASVEAASNSHEWLKQLATKRGATIKSTLGPTDFSMDEPITQRDFKANPIQPGELEEIMTPVHRVTGQPATPPSVQEVVEPATTMEKLVETPEMVESDQLQNTMESEASMKTDTGASLDNTPVEQSMRVLGDAFLQWNDLAHRASLMTSSEELSHILGSSDTSRLVKRLIVDQGFMVGLKLLSTQAKLDKEAAATPGKGQTTPEPAIPHNRSKMLRLLLQYCLFNRNVPLFHQLCNQLQQANMLPRPQVFHQLANEVLTTWARIHAESLGTVAPQPSPAIISEADVAASDVKASLLSGDDWTNVPTPLANSSNATLVAFLRAVVQWLCAAHKLPTDVWLSGLRVATPTVQMEHADLMHSTFDAPKLNASAIQIGFNAESLQKRLLYWTYNQIPLSVERVLNVYAFKTVCVLAIRGKYGPLANFMTRIQTVKLGIQVSAVYKSSIQWLVHHEYHQQANEVWTNMMINYVPRLKYHVKHGQLAARGEEPEEKLLQGMAQESVAFNTVQSLCNDLLITYVLKHEDDTMLFRVYATLRSMNLPPPPELLTIIPTEVVDTLSPSHQLLYILLHRVMHMQAHVKIEYMMKLFGELVKVPTMAPMRFTIRTDGVDSASPSSTTTKPSEEWPVVPPFLDAIAARIVPEYLRPSWPQKLAKPEFAEQIKKLILHLDSDDAMTFSATSNLDVTKQVKRDRLWNLFIELQSKGVVFNVPLLHHLAQSLATKDAIMLSKEPTGGDSEVVTNNPLPTVPIPTLVQQLWKLIVYHGEFDQNTLAFLIMAQFRHYQSAQQQRGLTLRTIRSLDYYRHILYGTPYDHPPVPRSSSLTSFADVASSGFNKDVALQWLGLDKLDQPLPNIVQMLFEQMDRDWHQVLQEDAERKPEPGEEDVEQPFDADVELPLNAHSYNYILQSCLLFTADSMPVRWSQIHAIRSLMADRHFMLNSTSVLYLLDTLIEARELQEARAMLPPPSTQEHRRIPKLETKPWTPKQTVPEEKMDVPVAAPVDPTPATVVSTEPPAGGSVAPTRSPPSTSLWSRIRHWFAGSDEQAAEDNTPPIATPAAVAAAAAVKDTIPVTSVPPFGVSGAVETVPSPSSSIASVRSNRSPFSGAVPNLTNGAQKPRTTKKQQKSDEPKPSQAKSTARRTEKKWSVPPQLSLPATTPVLYAPGVPNGFTDAEARTLLQPYGQIIRMRFSTPHSDNGSRSVLIELGSVEEARNVLKNQHNKGFETQTGKRIRFSASTNQKLVL